MVFEDKARIEDIRSTIASYASLTYDGCRLEQTVFQFIQQVGRGRAERSGLWEYYRDERQKARLRAERPEKAEVRQEKRAG